MQNRNNASKSTPLLAKKGMGLPNGDIKLISACAMKKKSSHAHNLLQRAITS